MVIFFLVLSLVPKYNISSWRRYKQTHALSYPTRGKKPGLLPSQARPFREKIGLARITPRPKKKIIRESTGVEALAAAVQRQKQARVSVSPIDQRMLELEQNRRLMQVLDQTLNELKQNIKEWLIETEQPGSMPRWKQHNYTKDQLLSLIRDKMSQEREASQ